MGSRPRRLLLGLIVTVFVALGIGFNLATPVYEGFDEVEHVAYVELVRETWSIPELPHDIFEALQPPAYYFLLAGISGAMGLPEPPRAVPNPAVAEGSDLFFIHTDEEREHPFRGGVGSVRALRLVSTLIGAATLLLVHATALRVFPGREDVALAVTAVTAWVPQFVSIHALVNNDSLAILFGALTLYAAVRLLQATEGRDRMRMAALAGLAVGLGLITKGYALAAIPVPFAALLLARWPRPQLLRAAAAVLGVVLLVAGWQFARNLALYGEPWPDRVAQVHLARTLPATIVERSVFDPVFRDVLPREVRDSFWYRGGFGQVQGPAGMYFGLDLVLLALTVGAIGAAFDPGRVGLGELQRRALALFAIALGLQLAGIVYYNLSVQQFQGRWLFSVQPAISVLMVVGAMALVPERARGGALVALPVALLGLTVFVLFAVTAPAFAA